MSKNEDYVTASSLAEKHGITMSTVRRRIQEGVLFKGAKKEQMSFGEVWKIPRSEAEAVSLKDLSPKVYQSRHNIQIEPPLTEGEATLSLEARVRSLENKITIFETLIANHLLK